MQDWKKTGKTIKGLVRKELLMKLRKKHKKYWKNKGKLIKSLVIEKEQKELMKLRKQKMQDWKNKGKLIKGLREKVFFSLPKRTNVISEEREN